MKVQSASLMSFVAITHSARAWFVSPRGRLDDAVVSSAFAGRMEHSPTVDKLAAAGKADALIEKQFSFAVVSPRVRGGSIGKQQYTRRRDKRQPQNSGHVQRPSTQRQKSRARFLRALSRALKCRSGVTVCDPTATRSDSGARATVRNRVARFETHGAWASAEIFPLASLDCRNHRRAGSSGVIRTLRALPSPLRCTPLWAITPPIAGMLLQEARKPRVIKSRKSLR